MSKENKMEKIAEALATVDSRINQAMYETAQNMQHYEITNLFNQAALDFFNLAISITHKKKLNNEYNFSGYMKLFETALKINVDLPIDRFTMIILEFAPDIYNENEKIFLDMEIPDGKINVGNEFDIIRSKEFQKLWKILNQTEKEDVKEKIVSLTTYAHIFFYRLLIDKQSNK